MVTLHKTVLMKVTCSLTCLLQEHLELIEKRDEPSIQKTLPQCPTVELHHSE